MSLQGAVATISIGGAVVMSYAYNAAIADGAVGVLARGGSGSFDAVRFRTNDPAFAAPPPPPLPVASIAGASVTEGNSASKTLTLTVSLSSAAVGGETVAWATSNGTASAGSDYTAASGTLTFAAGATSATFTVTVLGDTAIEPDETFVVTLSSPTGGLTLGSPSSATVTILNDDAGRSVSIANASTTEGNNGTKTLTLTLTLSSAAVGGETVAWATSNGTAAAGTDYNAGSGTVTFAAGATTATISLTIRGDRTAEPDETFVVTLSSPTGGLALGSPSQATVTIVNDDGAVARVATIAPVSVTEGNGGAQTVTLTVSLSSAAVGGETVAWTTSNGTAAASSDYTAASGTVTFAAGATTATFTVTVLGDATVEPNETFTVTLSAPTGGLTLGSPAAAAVTITNDDVASLPVVSVTSDAPNASEAGPANGSLTVSRTTTSGSLAIALSWSGSATFASDYALSVSGGTLSADRATLTLAAGVASAQITITPVADGATEATETVVLSVLAGAGYSVGAPASATVSIADAPPAPLTLSIADVTVTEGNNSTSNVTLTVTLSRAATGTVTIAYATEAAGSGTGFAAAGSDYTSKTGTLTFAAGQTTQTFTVAIVGDRTIEPTEIFNVVLSGATGGATIARSTAKVTIADNDAKLMATSSAPATATAEPTPTITAADAQPALQAAIAMWISAGADATLLASVTVRVADLPGAQLAYADANVIVLDGDAAGWGWQPDPYAPVAAGRIDLLTVLLHELGHILGYEHSHHGVMEDELAPGIRRLLAPAQRSPRAPCRQRVVRDATFGRLACGRPVLRKAGLHDMQLVVPAQLLIDESPAAEQVAQQTRFDLVPRERVR